MAKEAFAHRHHLGGIVEYIEPSEIKNLNSNDIIIVNRVIINSINLEALASNKSEFQKASIVYKAICAMLERDRKRKRIGFGAEITAHDALTIFEDIESLPLNSFVLVNN